MKFQILNYIRIPNSHPFLNCFPCSQNFKMFSTFHMCNFKLPTSKYEPTIFIDHVTLNTAIKYCFQISSPNTNNYFCFLKHLLINLQFKNVSNIIIFIKFTTNSIHWFLNLNFWFSFLVHSTDYKSFRFLLTVCK